MRLHLIDGNTCAVGIGQAQHLAQVGMVHAQHLVVQVICATADDIQKPGGGRDFFVFATFGGAHGITAATHDAQGVDALCFQWQDAIFMGAKRPGRGQIKAMPIRQLA